MKQNPATYNCDGFYRVYPSITFIWHDLTLQGNNGIQVIQVTVRALVANCFSYYIQYFTWDSVNRH